MEIMISSTLLSLVRCDCDELCVCEDGPTSTAGRESDDGDGLPPHRLRRAGLGPNRRGSRPQADDNGRSAPPRAQGQAGTLRPSSRRRRAPGELILRPTGLLEFLERQHFLHPPRLHHHRTRAPTSYRHGQGSQPTSLPPARPVRPSLPPFVISSPHSLSARRYIEVVDDRLTGEVLLDEALKMMKLSEKMSVGTWIDLMSGAFLTLSLSLPYTHTLSSC